VTLAEQQDILRKRIDANEKKLKSRRRMLAMRLRSNYERGHSGYMSVLLGSRDLHDYMSRSYYVERVVDNDVKLLDEIKTARLQLARDKKDLDGKTAEVKTLTASLEDDQAQFSQDHRAKEEMLTEIKEDGEKMSEALEAMEHASNTLESDLRALAQTPRGRARQQKAWTGSFIRPANGPITSRFGSRYHPVLHRTRMHTGVDIGAGHGSAIYAADGGEVIFAGYRNGYGNTVLVDHGGGVVTLYGHCSSLGVSVGQSVRKGQVIARVGSTGLATGPHLHFEVRRNGTPVDPL
jgi:murein DD-endopeptidase MepM/ murein hydrolase activator NlpD